MLTIFIMYVLLLLFMFLYVLLQYCIVLLSYILYFGNMQCTHIQYTTPSFVWYNYFNFPETSCNNHERKIPIKCENCQLGKKSNFSLITHESKLRFMYSTFWNDSGFCITWNMASLLYTKNENLYILSIYWIYFLVS